MNEPVVGGTEPPVQSSELESKKDKGKILASNTHLGKYGEGTSGSRKENTEKGENKRAGQCLPELKTIPKL